MKKLFSKTTAHPIVIMVLFVVFVAVSLVMWPKVEVNYDINDYLPDESPSTVAIDVMKDEFTGDIPNARVMIKNVTYEQAIEYKQKILAVDGVLSVTWLDDGSGLSAVQDESTIEKYYKNNNALLSVTIEEDNRIEAVNDIREIIGDNNAMTGSAVTAAVATESTLKEVSKIAVGVVAFVIFILIMTTTSWVEPFIILLGLGVAIAINTGSNLMFGEISFVTNAAGSILQLAVSLDYSVFLIHRFQECRKTNPDAKSAMVDALSKSTLSILSSGLTTVIGFLALCMMRFEIGPDLGLALAKGVALSLFSVFVFMPSFILVTYKLIDKTQHRPFVPKFDKFAKVVSKLMIPMACIFVVIIVPSFVFSNANNYYFGASHIFGTETQLGSDTEEIEDTFGKNDTYVLLVPNGDFALEEELSTELKTLPEVTGILSYVDTIGAKIPPAMLKKELSSKFISDNYSRMMISVDADYEGEDTFEMIENIKDIAKKYYNDEYYLAGEGIATYDLKNIVTSDMLKVNLIAIAAVFIVLLLTMKSLSLPVILVLGIETAVWMNLALPYIMGTSIFYIAYLIISTIQLGATVDYAILLTDRYMEFRRTMPKKQAIITTVSKVTVSIMTSASVLTVVGFMMGIISTHGLLSQLGFFVGKGTLCSLAVVLFVLPGMLYVFDGLIRRSTLKTNFFGNDNKKT